MEKFSNALSKLSTWVAQNRVLQVIQAAFASLLPITMVGSFVALFRGIDIGGWQAWIAGNGLYDALGTIYNFTTGLFAVYVVFLVGYQFSSTYNVGKGIPIGLTALAAFFIVTPYDAEASTISTTWLGATGMFTAMIIAFFVGFVYWFCQKYNLRIKLPEQVPQMIATQFSAIIPAAIAMVLSLVINQLFGLTSWGSIHSFIYSVVATPIQSVGSNIFGYYIIMVFLYLMWFFGIHGGMTVGSIAMLLFYSLQLENLTAYQAGEALPHMVTGTVLVHSSGSLPCVIALLLVAKSEQNKAIAKAGAIPALFGVDEPMYFGVPMILNPTLFLPWVIITPAIMIFGTYILEAIGLLGYPTCLNSNTFMPFFVQNFLNFGWRGVIWGTVLTALCVLVYIPFVKVYDKQKLAEEEAYAAQKAQAEQVK